MTKNYLISLFLVFVLLASNAGAGEIKKEFHFKNPEIVRTAGGVLLEIPGCRNIAHSGEPNLPVYAARFIIPRGERITNLSVETDRGVRLFDGIKVALMPQQLPIGSRGPGQAAQQPLGQNIYDQSSPFPERCGELSTVQSLSGLKIGFINIYPCQYIQSTGTVIFHRSITVTIETEPDGTSETQSPRIHAPILRKIRDSVENPELLDHYTTMDAGDNLRLRQGKIVPYVIITRYDMAAPFDSLAELKKLQGLNAEVVEIAWIQSNFPGSDTQESIRNFITYAHENWQTMYVLLGGDNEIIPNRPLYAKVGTEIEPDICSDLYYAALDGNWNTDGDSYFGEPGEEDLLPEVIVGRLPVDSAEEAFNAVSKIINYSMNPVSSQCKSYLSLGELLWTIDGEDTWGGDYKDEILYGSNNYDLETAGIPNDFAISTLYDRDMSFPWNKVQLLPLINAGAHLVNHLGHSNQFYVMRLSNSDVPLITCNGTSATHFILYSQGCFAGSFDNRDENGTYYEDDCIAEELLTSPTGAVAFIGNTRLGWDAPGSTCGASQFFDRQFFDAVFGEGINILGDVFEDSRFDNIPYISYPAIRYIFYEMTLLGDPAMPIWTDIPRTISASYDSVIINGQNTFEVEAWDEKGPIEGANASLFASSDDAVSYAPTDENGKAVFYLDGDIDGTLILSVFAPNHFPLVDTIAVIDSTVPLPTILSLTYDEDTLGTSHGDSDGIPEPAETVSVDLVLRNSGNYPLDNADVTILSDDQYITIIDTSFHIVSLPAGSWLIIDDELSFEISPETPNAHVCTWMLQVALGDAKWTFPQEFTINAGSPAIYDISITDNLNGNGNGCFEAWEFIDVGLTVKNEGSVDIKPSLVSLEFPEPSWGKAVKNNIRIVDLAPGESHVIDVGELEFFIREKTPEFTTIKFYLKVSPSNAPSRTETLSVRTCGYGLENDVGNTQEPLFTHSSVVGCDQWHISSEDYHSPPYSWKFGDTAQAEYYNMSDAVLTLPPVCLSGVSSLRFWHRMEAEASDVYPYWAEDVGVVEISTDYGKTWTIIDPVGLYPCKASGSNTVFISPYRRCYSGSIDWEEAEFDLSSYSGPVMLRFHFASNEQLGLEGWYIDDITVTTEHATAVDETPEARCVYLLGSAYPNPFNPTTVIPFELARHERVTIRIYDVRGREIKTLIDSVLPEGKHRAIWNGKDTNGRDVASGVYFARMRSGIFEASERLVLIR